MLEQLVKAFQNCDLDCAQWDEDILKELAQIALNAVEEYQLQAAPAAQRRMIDELV
jgi:hypothetical protein